MGNAIVLSPVINACWFLDSILVCVTTELVIDIFILEVINELWLAHWSIIWETRLPRLVLLRDFSSHPIVIGCCGTLIELNIIEFDLPDIRATDSTLIILLKTFLLSISIRILVVYLYQWLI